MISPAVYLDVADAAYRLTTDGVIGRAFAWQSALYERLAAPESDLGCLLLTPTGAGKMEAIIIPALGLRRGGAPRRVFLIGPDGAPLDDYSYRLAPYLRASVAADGIARTIYLDTWEAEAAGVTSRRFLPDGGEESNAILSPLEADVDLVLTTFGRFRDLFFGGGGVHALPSSIAPEEGDTLRRDLFFFDEAQEYAPDAFSRFHRLVEFLFAQDTDVVIGSSTLPVSLQEELSFLELIAAPADSPRRTLRYQAAEQPLRAMEGEIRRVYYQNSRVICVASSPDDAETLHARLAPAYPHSVYLYHPQQSSASRRQTYAQLRELEKEGEGYLLLTTGDALETSDLDATVLLTALCPPENLIRRAGRCNRRGELPDAQIIVVGDTFAPDARLLNPTQSAAYLAALRDSSNAPFDADFWKTFI